MTDIPRTGSVALITGGSSGIGRAVARLVIARGGRVALVARTTAALDAAVEEFGADRAIAYPLDVRDLDRLAALPAAVKSHFGRLDLLVNNAGLNHRGSMAKWTPEQLADVVTTNLTAPIVLTRAALDHVTPGGAIIQVASLSGVLPVPGEATYSASKAGLRAFARSAADDFARLDVHVGCISPGPVDTPFLGDLSEVADITLSQPMISPELVAEAVLRCADERIPEIALPRRSARLASLAYLFPGLAAWIRPGIERRGARNRQAIVARRGAGGPNPGGRTS